MKTKTKVKAPRKPRKNSLRSQIQELTEQLTASRLANDNLQLLLANVGAALWPVLEAQVRSEISRTLNDLKFIPRF